MERQAGNLAADGIEAGEQDGIRTVVDDDLNAGEGFESPDVASLTTDDAPFNLVIVNVEHAHGVLNGGFGGGALDGLQHNFLGFLLGSHLGVFSDFFHIDHGLCLCVILDEFDQLVFGVFY